MPREQSDRRVRRHAHGDVLHWGSYVPNLMFVNSIPVIKSTLAESDLARLDRLYDDGEVSVSTGTLPEQTMSQRSLPRMQTRVPAPRRSCFSGDVNRVLLSESLATR